MTKWFLLLLLKFKDQMCRNMYWRHTCTNKGKLNKDYESEFVPQKYFLFFRFDISNCRLHKVNCRLYTSNGRLFTLTVDYILQSVDLSFQTVDYTLQIVDYTLQTDDFTLQTVDYTLQTFFKLSNRQICLKCIIDTPKGWNWKIKNIYVALIRFRKKCISFQWQSVWLKQPLNTLPILFCPATKQNRERVEGWF